MPSFGSSGGGQGGLAPRGPQGPLAPIRSSNTESISWVTGPVSSNSTYDRLGMSGTDLGITWDNGSGQTLMAFGDTFGNCSLPGQQWRNNVLLRSNDTNPADGIDVHPAVVGDRNSGAVVNPANFASQVIPSLRLPMVEATTIPTAAISLNGKQYINYMSVREWGTPGNWTTNFSNIAVSEDNGQTWTSDANTIRANVGFTVPTVRQLQAGNPNFQMNAYAQGNDEFVYQYGTPSGRFGAAHLARFLPEDIMDTAAYEYFGADGWSASVDDAVPVVGGPVSEMSVAWNEYLQRYVMLYGDETQGSIVARTSIAPEGPWSAPTTLLGRVQTIGGVYAPYIHPQSNGRDLYFTASRWSDYNVMLLKTNLDALPR